MRQPVDGDVVHNLNADIARQDLGNRLLGDGFQLLDFIDRLRRQGDIFTLDNAWGEQRPGAGFDRSFDLLAFGLDLRLHLGDSRCIAAHHAIAVHAQKSAGDGALDMGHQFAFGDAEGLGPLLAGSGAGDQAEEVRGQVTGSRVRFGNAHLPRRRAHIVRDEIGRRRKRVERL